MRPTIPLVLLALASSVVPAFAQEPQGAPPAGSAHGDAWVFNQLFADNTFSDNYATVVLMADVAYRLELRPIGPSLPPHDVSLRYLDQTNLPPLALTPLSDPPVATGGEAFELRPVASGVYRIDVKTEDWMDVRIVRDEHETERWARVRTGAHTPNAMSGLSLRAAWIGGFARPGTPASLAGPAGPPGKSAATGAEACLDVAPSVTWAGRQITGCALTVAWYFHSEAPDLLAIGTAPRLILSGRRSSAATFAVLSLGVATAMGNGDSFYTMVGPGIGVQGHAGQHVLADLEVDGLWVYALNLSKHNNIAPRIGLGLQYLL